MRLSDVKWLTIISVTLVAVAFGLALAWALLGWDIGTLPFVFLAGAAVFAYIEKD